MSTPDPVQPKQNYPEEQYKLSSSGNLRASGGGRTGGTAIAIGVAMLVGGIALTAVSPRIFIGLIVFGVVNIIRGIASSK